MDRLAQWFVLLGALLLLVACTGGEAADEQGTAEPAPGLQPASSLLALGQPTAPALGLVGESGGTPAAPTLVPTATFRVDDPQSTGVPLSRERPESKAEAGAQSAEPTLEITTEAPFNPEPFVAGPVDCATEIDAYQEYLSSDPDLATYQALTVAACYLERGERPAAISVYEAAIERGADLVTEVLLRQGLAELLVEEGNYPAALAHFEAILGMAETEKTRGQVLYQAGQTELLAGNQEAGYGRFLTLVNEYPAAEESYLALSELVEAGYAVDGFQHGLVAYHAEAYEAAIGAFNEYVATDPAARRDTFLYLAWSLEEVGKLEEALAHIDAYIEASDAAGDPGEEARGWIERAEMQVRAGRLQGAIEDYQSYLVLFPQGEDAAYATWQSAALAEELGNLATAVARYRAFAEIYPGHRDASYDAAEALFRAGYLSWRLDGLSEARRNWQQALDAYPEREFGEASLLWLLKVTPAGEANSLVALALNNSGRNYYGLRARHLATGVTPFAAAGGRNLFMGDAGREEAEEWLRAWLGLEAGVEVAELSETLAGDARLINGEKLWLAGQRAAAKGEFESLRADYAHDGLASYQLAIYFRDLGLYRSSILAATSVMILAKVGATGAPGFIARLAYPTYYADLVSAEASAYGYDPLLQLALIREESFFESFATSAAGARGLAQLLPETGAWVAQRLNQPAYNLYDPAVGIAFGAYYLDQQLAAFDGNVAAALAAYNAGPGFAEEWYEGGVEDHDSFLEAVEFPETQRYIKQIYNVHNIYRFLYG